MVQKAMSQTRMPLRPRAHPGPWVATLMSTLDSTTPCPSPPKNMNDELAIYLASGPSDRYRVTTLAVRGKCAMHMQVVQSSNVHSVGYDEASRAMRVQFQAGGLYEYAGVNPDLYASMLRPNPWRRLGDRVKQHRCRRIA